MAVDVSVGKTSRADQTVRVKEEGVLNNVGRVKDVLYVLFCFGFFGLNCRSRVYGTCTGSELVALL